MELERSMVNEGRVTRAWDMVGFASLDGCMMSAARCVGVGKVGRSLVCDDDEEC